MSATCCRHVARQCRNILLFHLRQYRSLTLYAHIGRIFLAVFHWNDDFDFFYSIMNGCDVLAVMSQVEQLQAKYYYTFLATKIFAARHCRWKSKFWFLKSVASMLATCRRHVADIFASGTASSKILLLILCDIVADISATCRRHVARQCRSNGTALLLWYLWRKDSVLQRRWECLGDRWFHTNS